MKWSTHSIVRRWVSIRLHVAPGHSQLSFLFKLLYDHHPLCRFQMCATALTCQSLRSSVFWRSSCRCIGCGLTPSTATTTMTGCTLPWLRRMPGSTWPPSRLKRHSSTSVSLALRWFNVCLQCYWSCWSLFFKFRLMKSGKKSLRWNFKPYLWGFYWTSIELNLATWALVWSLSWFLEI